MDKTMAELTPMQSCPMAGMCKGMMQMPFSGIWLIVPGIVLILLRVTVLLEPRIVIWLIAAALLMMGVAMLVLARVMRKIGARFQG